MLTEFQERQNSIMRQSNLQQQNLQNSMIQQRTGLIPQQFNMQQRNQMTPQQFQINQQNALLQQQPQITPNIGMQGARTFPLQISVPVQGPGRGQIINPEERTPKTVELVIRKEETKEDKAEKANEAFEKLLQFMTIMGQVDTYLSERTHSAIRKLAKLAEESSEEEDKRHSIFK